MKISKEKLIKYLRLNAKSFVQYSDNEVSVSIILPETIELED